MPKRTMLTRTALAALAAALIAAPGASAMQDARGEAAAGASSLDQSASLPPRDLPVLDADDGVAVDLPIVLLAVAGTLAVAGGMAVATSRVETRTAL